MLNPSSTGLVALWFRILEQSLEAGQTPVIGLGLDELQPDAVVLLQALGHLSGRRFGAVDPLFAVGGEGPLWLLALANWQRTGVELAPGESFWYGGNDVTTYAATLDILTPENGRANGNITGANIQLGMQWMLYPASLPGAGSRGLEWQPFAMVEPFFSQTGAEAAPERDWLDGAESWLALLLAVGLVIAALLV